MLAALLSLAKNKKALDNVKYGHDLKMARP